MISENTGKIHKGGKFPKGLSGNPKGKPKGSRNKASLLAEKLFSNDISDICKAVIEQAKSGDMQAAKIVLDRLFPPRKDRYIDIELPKIETCKDMNRAMSCIVNAVGLGQISPSEGEALARIIDIHAKAIELTEFESRLSALEEAKK